MMMKTIASVCAVAIGAMSFSGAAFARDHDGDRGHDRGSYQQRDHGNRGDHAAGNSGWQGRDGNHWQGHGGRAQVQAAPAYRYNHSPRYEYRAYNAPSYNYRAAPRYVYNSGYSPRWHVGSYYSGPRYVVSNWSAYPGLYAPPYGYQWVQSDTGEFLLVALATGLIANLLMNSRF